MRVTFRDPVIPCARADRFVSALECCSMVCATESHDDLNVCRFCAHGRDLAATSRLRISLPPLPDSTQGQPQAQSTAAVFSPEKEKTDPVVIKEKITPQKAAQGQKAKTGPKKAVEIRPQEALSPDVVMRIQLARTMARLLKDYPASRTHGLRFVLLAAEQFDFAGSMDDVTRLLLAAGLHITSGSRQALRVDEAMRVFATQGSKL